MKNIFRFLLNLLLGMGCAFLFTHFLFQFVNVSGTSMMPTYKDGQLLVMNKIEYRFQDPERYDVVVIKTGGTPACIIKRIIGLPGETIRIEEDGDIFINGEILRESYGAEVIKSDLRGRAAFDVNLKEGEYFVLGDNRNFSKDSRSEDVGNIKKAQLLGKIITRK